MKQPVLKGKLVTLRLLKTSDALRLIELLKDPRVSQYLKIPLHPPPSLKDEKAWIKKTHQQSRKGVEYNWAVVHNATSKVVGVISLMKIVNSPFVKTAETGTWLSREYWGKGLNREAKKLIIDFAFKKLKLQRVELHCRTDNKRSQKAIEKLGAKFEGTARNFLFKKNKWHDLHRFAILRKEWKR